MNVCLFQVVLTINPNFNSNKMAQWFDMEEIGKKKKDDATEPEQLKVKLKILMDRPQNIKNCGSA